MAYTIYVQFKNGTQSTIAGVTAETKEDIDYYDGSTYRDGPYYASGVQHSGGTGAINTNFNLSTNAHVVLGNSTGAALTTVTPGATTEAVADDVLKIPPRPHPRKRSRYKWTTADGVFWAWADLIVAVSSSTHTYV